MKRRPLLSLTLLMLFTTAAFAETKSSGAQLADQHPGCDGANARTAQARGKIVAKLAVQADSWDKAIVRKDREAIERNLADDFRQIDGQGTLETKQSFVADLVSPDLDIKPYTVEDLDIRLYGDVALITGRTRMTGKYQGKPFASHYRYTDVYVCRGGDWKIVSIQISKIPGP